MSDFEESGGNVFEDLGLPNPEERLHKAKIASKIIDFAKRYDFSQEDISEILSIDKTDVSDLFRGRLDKFSSSDLAILLSFCDVFDIAESQSESMIINSLQKLLDDAQELKMGY